MAARTDASNKLTVTLPSDREIVMTRVFAAPRRLVFAAMTQRQHLTRWWGRAGSTLPVCELDFRPGGKWRFVERHGDQDYGFRGEFREIVPPERVVQTFEFEGFPGHISVETMTLVERDGRTTLTTRSVFDSQADRDGMLRSGMEDGANESMDRLEALLGKLVSG